LIQSNLSEKYPQGEYPLKESGPSAYGEIVHGFEGLRKVARAVDVPKTVACYRYFGGWADTVWVNCYNVMDTRSPFGAFKQSGIGLELGRVRTPAIHPGEGGHRQALTMTDREHLGT
jgi:hypothetical protein